MKQQVDIVSKTTLQVPAKFDLEAIKSGFESGTLEEVSIDILTISEEREIYQTENQYVYRTLQTRDGERAYDHKGVHIVPMDTTPEEFVDDLAANFWDEDQELEDGGYYHIGGEVHVSVKRVEKITKHEYETLKKFL